MKIAVIGYSGSGKSFLSDRLAHLLKTPIMHLDTVKYDKKWNARDKSLVLRGIHFYARG